MRDWACQFPWCKDSTLADFKLQARSQWAHSIPENVTIRSGGLAELALAYHLSQPHTPLVCNSPERTSKCCALSHLGTFDIHACYLLFLSRITHTHSEAASQVVFPQEVFPDPPGLSWVPHFTPRAPILPVSQRLQHSTENFCFLLGLFPL